jgi:hypothetical protein
MWGTPCPCLARLYRCQLRRWPLMNSLNTLPAKRRGAFTGLLLIAALLLVALPSLPVHAQLGVVTQIIDDTQGDYADGVFQRSAVSADRITGIDPDDEAGALVLAPSGVLNPWDTGPFIAEAVANAGTAALATGSMSSAARTTRAIPTQPTGPRSIRVTEPLRSSPTPRPSGRTRRRCRRRFRSILISKIRLPKNLLWY